MAKICAICDKRPRTAQLVSHTNVKTKRWVYPNVHKMRFKLANNASNKVYRGNVCTKCVKAEKVEKVF